MSPVDALTQSQVEEMERALLKRTYALQIIQLCATAECEHRFRVACWLEIRAIIKEALAR